MAHTLTVTGVTGSLMWGYHVAASVRAWTVTKTDDGWSLSASVERADGFTVSQSPLAFVAPHARGAWRWPVRTLEITAGSLTADLGPKENANGLSGRTP